MPEKNIEEEHNLSDLVAAVMPRQRRPLTSTGENEP